jgi:hypothetical protein
MILWKNLKIFKVISVYWLLVYLKIDIMLLLSCIWNASCPNVYWLLVLIYMLYTFDECKCQWFSNCYVWIIWGKDESNYFYVRFIKCTKHYSFGFGFRFRYGYPLETQWIPNGYLKLDGVEFGLYLIGLKWKFSNWVRYGYYNTNSLLSLLLLLLMLKDYMKSL